MTAPVLEVQGVTKAYGDDAVLPGGHRRPGAPAVALIGSSAGKSTLLRCIDLLEEIATRRAALTAGFTDPCRDPVPVRAAWGWSSRRQLFPH